MRDRNRRGALFFLLASSILGVATACGQDLRTIPLDSPGDRLAGVLLLEDLRCEDPEAWKRVLLAATSEPERLRTLLAVGRVGAQALIPLVASELLGASITSSAESLRTLAQAIGFSGARDLLGPFSKVARASDLALAFGLVGDPPPSNEDRALVLSKLKSVLSDPGAPQEIALEGEQVLCFAARIAEPLLLEESLRLLELCGPGPFARGAAYYLARHAAKPPERALKVLGRWMVAADPETAAYAAKALGRCEGASEAESALLVAAYGVSATREVQIERLRALTKLPLPQARSILLEALKDPDSAIKRAALSVLTAGASTLDERDRRGLSAMALALVESDPLKSLALEAIPAMSALTPSSFRSWMKRMRLAETWFVRAGIARAISSDESPDATTLAMAGALLEDPDRRVSQTLLEGLAERALSGHSTWIEFALREDRLPLPGADPVRAALFAQIAANARKSGKLKEASVGAVSTFHLAFLSHPRTRSFDPELLLSFLDLGEHLGTEAFHQFLRGLCLHEDPSIRQAARASALRQKLADLEAWSVSQSVVVQRTVKARELARRLLEGRMPSRCEILTTQGILHAALFPEVAPWTVARLMELAEKREEGLYGVRWHRVVPAFVVQTGCPRGDGYGASAPPMRCELSDLPFLRGTLGIALAGKDTGASQFFITHVRTPHLDARYTVLGRVTMGWEVLDALTVEDLVVEVRFFP